MTPRAKITLSTFAVLSLAASTTAVASPPTAPGALSALSVSSTQTNLTWTASTDSGATITAYVIQRCQGTGCTSYTQVGNVSSGTVYYDSGLTAATVYQYQVYATDSNSTSSPVSNTATATTMVASISSAVTYGYDALGRLVQANVAALNIVENYTYDAAGNITSVTSSPAATLEVASLSSPQGPVGGTVTIYGSGFSTTPASNTVDFNGIAATVISATSTELVVTVPTGATNGPVTVKTGSTTVSGPGSYTITASTGAPTIASLLTPVAATGDTVTITGTGFQSVLADNQVQVNQTAATVVAATATSLTFVVPSFDADTQSSSTFSAMSAPITVSTPYGSVTSSTDLIISGALIGAPVITTIGAAPVTFATPSAGVAQLLAFNATAGQPIELIANNQTTPGTLVGTVIAPNGTTAARLNFTASGQSLQVATPVTGRYTVYFYPYGAQGGSVSFSVIGALNATLTLNGSPTTETLSFPGQSAQLVFAGTQGQNIALSFTNVTLSASATLALQAPDGAPLLSQTLTTAGLVVSPTLPASGTYTVLITPAATASGAFTATLNSVATTTLALNHGAQSFTLTGTTPLTLTFDASAGQIVTVTAAETAGASSTLTPSILQPDGTLLATTYRGLCPTCGTSLYYNLGPLTQTGTYSLVAQQSSTATNTFAVTLATPAAASATVGTPASVTLAQMGQAASVTFQGAAGQYVSASLATTTALGSTGTLAVLGPDGTTIASGITSNCSGGCDPQGVISAGPLPATGTYSVLFEQSPSEPPGSGSLTITVLPPVTGTINVGASNPVVVASGQGFAETFSASAGQTLSVTLQSTGAGAPTNGTATVLDPNGAPIASTTFNGHNGYPTSLGFAILNIGPLQIGGSYTVLFQQATSSAGLGAGTVEVTPELSASGSLTVGSATNVSLAAGQGFAETFAGTAGQYLSFAVGAQNASAPTAGTVELLSPTGVVVSSIALSGNCSPTCNGEADLDVGPLPVTGQYTLVFQQADSFYSTPGSGSVTITPEAAIQGTLTLGTPAVLSLAAGQGVQQTFSGTAGQYATVTVSENASLVQGAKITVLDPFGNTVATGAFAPTCSTTCSGTFSLNMGPLSSSGTYTVLLQQTTTAYAFGSGSLTLTVAGNTANSGSSQNLTTTTAGQIAQFTFTAAALQTFELSFSNMVLTPSSVTGYTIQVLNPSGGVANNGSCTSGTTCLVQIAGTATGTYTVKVTPSGAATMSLTAGVGPLKTGTLALGTPFNLNLSEPGENASLIFTATAGQDLVLDVSGMTAVPVGSYYTVDVYDPTSTLVAASYPTSSATLNVPVALTGTYTVSISTLTGTTASMQLTLSSGASASLPSTGTGVNLSTSLPNQHAYYTFSGTFGQSLTFAVGSIVQTPSTAAVPTVIANGPSGSGASWGATCTASSCVAHSPPLPVSGTYTATLTPGNGATMSATAYLSPDVTGALTPGTPLNLTLSETGQSASLTFAVTGEAPQAFGLAVTNLSATPTATPYTVTISNFNQRDGTVVSGQVTTNSQFSLPNLPPGTYVVTVTPTAPATATMQLTLSAAVTATLLPGVTQNLTPGKMGQGAFLTFNVAAGQIFALNVAGIASAPANTSYGVTVYNLANTSVASASSATGTTFNLANLAAGTYTVFITPLTPATASLQATLESQVGGTLQLAGNTNSYSTPAPGQNAYFTFSGTAGQDLGIALTGLTLTPSSQQTFAWVYIYEPNGTTLLTYQQCFISTPGAGCEFTLTNLPVTGNYQIQVLPGTQQTMSFNLTASQDVTGTLALNTPKSVTLVPGQNTWLTFNATAGQTVAVSATSIVTNPANQNVSLTVYNSSGTSVANATGASNATVNLPNLAAGTYSVLIVPGYGAPATMQVTLAAGIAPTLTLNGTTANYATTQPGQYAYFYFSAIAGQDLGIVLTGLTLTPSSQQTDAIVYVYEPNGTTVLTYNYFYTTAAGLEFTLTNLPVTGTYRVQVMPGTQQTMSFNLTASQDVSGTLALNTPQNVTLVPGQNTWLSFAATANESVAVSATSIVTSPAGENVALTVYNSSGTSVGTATGTGNVTVNLTNLPAGTYSVLIVPSYGASGTMQVTLATGIAPTLTLNGTTANYATTEPGQYAYFYFSGTAGQNLGIALTGLVLTPSSQQNYTTVYVYEPNGTTVLTYNFFYTTAAGLEFSLTNLPVTGTYRVQVMPGTQQTMSFNLTASQDVSGTLALNTPQNVTLVPGQNTWLTFTATAGETVAVSASSIVTNPAGENVGLTVYNSSNASIGSVTGVGNATVNLTNLAAGTYSVLIAPYYGASATMQVTVAAGIAPTLTLNGTTANYATTQPGQYAYFYFAGTAGQDLSVALTGLTLTPSAQQTYATVYIYEPNGTTVLTYNFYYTSASGLQFNLPNLPLTGTYRIQVVPGTQQTMSLNLTAAQDVTGTLTLNTPQNVTLAAKGQNAWLTFSIASAQTVTVTTSGITSTPANTSYGVVVYNSAGTSVGSTSTTSGNTLTLTSLAAGTYNVLIGPSSPATATLQVSYQ
jgi:large repetitive protein